MAKKQIQQILPPPPPHMVGNGFRVHNFFPHGYDMNMARMSPFYLLDYNAKIEFSPSATPRGVDVHAHRGFETVTLAYHGKIAHHDSRGNAGVISEGDLQWMTAASGVLHKEYHEEGFSREGGPFQIVQLWINLPKKNKMAAPRYQAINNNKIPKINLPGNAGRVDVITGSFNGVKGTASTFSPIEMYNIRLKNGGMVSFNLPANYNTGILVVEGSVTVNGDHKAPTDNFILFKNEGEEITLQAAEDSVLLVLSGEPINEPIVAYGPFVMNTKEEIIEAYEDLNHGKFGRMEE